MAGSRLRKAKTLNEGHARVGEKGVALYVSAIIGGPELSKALIADVLARVFSEERIDGGTNLDIVFHVPGSAFAPEFEGLRTGRLSRQENILQVQVAVPPSVVRMPRKEIIDFVFDSLRQAIQLARVKLTKAKVQFGEGPFMELVDRMEADSRLQRHV